MTIYSKEFIEKSNIFAETIESDAVFLKKIESANAPPLSKEEQKVVEDFLESGDPRAWEFLTKFIQSDFFKNIVENY